MRAGEVAELVATHTGAHAPKRQLEELTVRAAQDFDAFIRRPSRRRRPTVLKTIDDFDFRCQSTVKLSLLGSAVSPGFVTDGRCLILHGKSGRGKTHLAFANGYRAIQNSFDTLFVSAPSSSRLSPLRRATTAR